MQTTDHSEFLGKFLNEIDASVALKPAENAESELTRLTIHRHGIVGKRQSWSNSFSSPSLPSKFARLAAQANIYEVSPIGARCPWPPLRRLRSNAAGALRTKGSFDRTGD